MKFKTFIRNLRTNNNPKVHLFKLVSLATMIFGFVALMIFCNNKGQNRVINCNGIVQTDKEKTYSIHENIDSIIIKADSVKLTEHRVYYVDYSYSMVYKPNDNVDGTGHTLLDLVKDNLKKSIRDIKDKDVSIEIIPFLDSVLWSGGKPNNIYKISKKSGKGFDERELEKMDDFIDNIKPIKKPNGGDYATHHSIVINDFLENRIKDAKQYHMMILLTDGADFSAGDKVLKEKWDSHINGKSVFGIFVNLPKENITGKLPELFKGKESHHRYFVKGTNFDFNVVELTKPSPVMIRENNIALISIGGRCPKFKNTTKNDSFYQYTLTQPSSSYLQIKIDTLVPKTNLPNKHKYPFQLEYDSVDNTRYFLSENEIELTIIDKKTPNINFSIAGKTSDSIPCISDKIRYCKKLFGCIDPEWSDTITIKIAYEKSDDAKSRKECNNSRLKISGLPDYVTLKSGNEIPLNKPSDTLSVQLVLDLTKDFSNDSIISGSVEMTGVENFKYVSINDCPLNGKENSTIIGAFRFSTDKCLNPWVIRILCILAILFLLWLLSMEYIKYWRSKKPRFNTSIVLQFYTEPKETGLNFDNNCIILKNVIGDKTFLKEYIGCISLKVGVKEISHKIWSMRKWWKFKNAFKGDTHTLPLDENELVSVIELRPAKDGGYEISCCKDNIHNEEPIIISNIGERKEIYSITRNGEEIRFCVEGLQPEVHAE